MDCLKEEGSDQGFTEAISGRFAALGNTVEYRSKTLDAAQESTGDCPRVSQNFILQETPEATERMSILTGDWDLHRPLRTRILPTKP